MTTDRNKTHSVLTDAEIAFVYDYSAERGDRPIIDRRRILNLALAIETAVLAKAVAQSPVAHAPDVRTVLAFIFDRFGAPGDAGEIPANVIAAIRRLEQSPVAPADEQPRYNYGPDGKGPVSLLNGDRLRDLVRDIRSAAPTPPTSAADVDLLASLARVADDLEDCGETEMTGSELAAMAQRGWLDCTRFVVTPQGYAAIAASKETT